jgi:hypothetical protein
VNAYRHQKPAPVRQEITPPVDFSSTTGPWDRRASAAKLASFCAIPRGAQPAARNWLCFARTPLLVVPGRHLSIRNPQSPIRDHGPPAQELALFCRGCLVGQFTISSSPPGTYHFLPSAGIGFVLHTCSCSPDGKLGSFCTFHSPAEERPTPRRYLPTYPSLPKFGFVLHNRSGRGPREDCPGRPNWVRFVRLP